MRKKLVGFVGKHWIILWALLSILYAVIIHILFSFTAPNRFFEAHWGAGDILTYASTVSLGLLALWQNKKLQEENEQSQEKLENIIIRSNELSIISKIIEHEERRINELNQRLNEFMQSCDPQALAITQKSNDIIEQMIDITELERTIDNNFFVLGRLLREDRNLKSNDKDPFKLAFSKLYICAKTEINNMRTGINNIDSVTAENVAEKMAFSRNKFMEEKEKYMLQQDEKLHKLLFENLTVEEARKLCG